MVRQELHHGCHVHGGSWSPSAHHRLRAEERPAAARHLETGRRYPAPVHVGRGDRATGGLYIEGGRWTHPHVLEAREVITRGISSPSRGGFPPFRFMILSNAL